MNAVRKDLSSYVNGFLDLLILDRELPMFFTDNGTLVIGRGPALRPMREAHVIMFPRRDEDYLEKYARIKERINIRVEEFFSELNGCHLFYGHFCIFGFRTNWIRSLDDNNIQPYDIETESLGFLPDIRIASYYNNSGGTLITNHDDEIKYIHKKDRRVRRTWPNFGSMLKAECSRINRFFDVNLTPIDLCSETLPPPTIQ